MKFFIAILLASTTSSVKINEVDSDYVQTMESKGTYPSKDSASYITPYNQRDHAWNEPQYDMSNETHWVVGTPRGHQLDVTRPLYHEISNGTVGGGKDFHGAVDQPGFDNHYHEPTLMMTMSEALEAHGLTAEPML